MPGVFFLALFFIVLSFSVPSRAAIIQDAPPIDAFFPPILNVGGGAIVPLAKFRLVQSSGSDALTKVGIRIIASTTMSSEISRISLWKESGTTPDFQINQDIYIEGTASTSPATNGALIVLTPASPVFVGTQSTEFFIVASTTGVANITNGDAFNVHLQNNYASTSASGIGTEFLSNKKIVLTQSATLKISEVKIGASGNTADEFIELYNAGDAAIDLKQLPLNLHIYDVLGSSSPKTINYYKTVIPPNGFFLITSQTNYSGSVPADAVYSTVSGNTLAPDTGFSIATSSSATAATSTAIDRIGWGTEPPPNCENFDTILTACATALAEDGTSLERIAVGYPDATSTAQSMTQGGPDASKGNGVDKNDNSAEFIAQTTPVPQNSLSATEFSFGGGSFDTSTLQVMGSFPQNGMVSVPKDMPFIGFDFNKVVATTSIVSATPTTTVSLIPTAGGSNLCASVSYNQFHGNFEPAGKCNLTPSSLSDSTSYTFTITSSVKDLSGNQLDQDAFQAGNQNYTAVFTTGTAGQTFTNVTPPFVMGTSPFPGSQNIPTNLSTISVEFNQSSMDTTTFTSANITLGGVSLSGFSFSTTTGRNVLSITPGALSAGTQYTLTIGTGVKSSNGISLPGPFVSVFFTGSQDDLTGPQIVGVLPTPGSTIPANTNDFIFIFDDNIDVTTATTGAITLAIAGGSNLPGTVQYSPISKEGHFIPQNVLPTSQSIVLTIKGGSIKNVSGTKLGNDLTRAWTVETTNSDTTGPNIIFANADDFNMAITFNEAINSTDATNLSNYSLIVGGATSTLSALAGHSISYDPTNRTAKIIGVRMTSGATFTVTASNIKDISGNTTSQSSFSGTVTSFAASGGFVGPSSFTGTTFGTQTDFSASGIGFMPPVTIRPQSTFINASTTYTFELPIAKQISAGGSIVITLPSSSDFGICCSATTSTSNPFIASQNSDINGPGPFTIGIQSVTSDPTAKTITVVIDTATRNENSDTHDFLKFSLAGIKNPSIPKGIDSSGYVFDIKTKNSSGNLLETLTANPVFITGSGVAGGGATTTIRGTVSGNGGNLQGVTIHLMSPQTGPVDAVTDTNGLYQFTSMPVNSQFLTNNFGGGGDYYLFTNPFVNPAATSTGFFGSSMPTPVQATSTSIITRNFALTATTTAINFTVNLTASANTFTSTEELDIFAGGPGQFVVRTVTPGVTAYSAQTLAVIAIPASNGTWNIGMGPAMPKGGGGGGFSGPPPSPNWAMPRPVEVVVSGCPSACSSRVDGLSATSNTFNISTADKTIAGILKDGSGNTIASAMIFAFSPTGGNGNTGQTSTGGTFSIRVVSGSYVVGAYVPGVGKSRETPVVVDSSGNVFVDGSQTASTGSAVANPFILKMVKPSYTITGQVTDGTNAIGNAPVFAYRTDAPGRIDASTDSSTGNYTLYVDNGTWKVSAFIPGFGPMTEQTVIISNANQSSINFAPSSSANYSILSGNIYEDANSNNAFNTGEGITGAIIRLSGTSGINEGVSGNDGAFTVRVPSGTNYFIIDVFQPSYGKIAALKNDGTPIGAINLTASTTQNIRVPVRNTITINIKDSNGAPLLVPKAYIDLFATSTRQGNHIEITNGTTTSLLVASGTQPIARAYIQGVPASNVSVSSDSDNTVISGAGGIIIDNTTEIIKVVVDISTASLSTVLGTVYSTSQTSGNELADAWLQFVDDTNGVHFGTQATSSGTYSIKASNGTYQVLVSKPGYIGSPITLVVSGTTTQNFVLSPANLTISGSVTAGGQPAPNAFVRAEKVGGGQAVTQADTSGAYTLKVTSGTWRVFAAAEGYAPGAYGSNPLLVSSSVSGITVALNTTVSLQSKLATSDTFTDTSAGSFTDSTVGVSVNLDSNTLGSSGNSSYMTANETSNIADTVSVNIVGNKAKEINAFSGGSQVTNLQSGKKATVELTYTVTELNAAGITTTAGVSALKVVAYSEDKQEWESLSTVNTPKDSSGNSVALPASNLSNVSSITFTAVGTHFSDYALSNPTGASPPSTPTGVTATAGAAGSKNITVSWTAVSDAEGYYVYKDTSDGGSFPLLANAGNVTSYVSGDLSMGTKYYYKVSAYKSSGVSESAASDSVNATALNYQGGGIVGGSSSAYAPTPAPTTAPALITPTTATTVTPAPGAVSTVPAATVAKPSPVALQVSPVFTKALSRGMSNPDIRRLQELLANDKTLYPEGIVSGFFGALTEKAVGRFQEKYGVAKAGDAGYGTVGPKTRAKLTEVFSGGVPALEIAKPSPVALQVSPVFTKALSRGMSNPDIRRLQELLANDKTLYPEGIVSGFFGALTEKAVGRFQEKYGVAFSGDAGYGFVGPKTSAKLSEVFTVPQ